MKSALLVSVGTLLLITLCAAEGTIFEEIYGKGDAFMDVNKDDEMEVETDEYILGASLSSSSSFISSSSSAPESLSSASQSSTSQSSASQSTSSQSSGSQSQSQSGSQSSSQSANSSTTSSSGGILGTIEEYIDDFVEWLEKENNMWIASGALVGVIAVVAIVIIVVLFVGFVATMLLLTVGYKIKGSKKPAGSSEVVGGFSDLELNFWGTDM